ncbi:MAG TPA: amidohydrolase family protein [Gemmatimonadota bacterium]|nr:amidohydrolase family protein [Gemmatimonadota bacterium]
MMPRRGRTAIPGLSILTILLALPGPAGALRAQAPDTLATEVSEVVAIDAPVVALTHVQVVDGTGAPPMADQTIVIDDGRIVAVGPAAEVDVPDNAEVLDLAGHTVIPGIVGMHNHTFYTTAGRRAQLTFSAPRLYLGSGVTTIRTTGSYHPYSELSLQAAIERGEVPGPRMHVTGPYLTGGGGVSYMTQLAGPEDARRVVGYWADEGVTWFKAYTLISRAELGAVIDEAHERGLKVTGHLCSVSFQEAVELGIDNLEHGFFTNTDYEPGKPPDECPEGFRENLLTLDMEGAEVQATFDDMIENGVAMTSTLAIYELIVPDRPPLEDRVLDVLAPEARADYLESREEIAANAAESDWPEIFRRAQAYEKAFVEAGGLLAAGVDPTGIGGAPPGFGDQRNYELLIEAGFTPVEAIEVMTANGARVLGEYDQYGSIEEGKLAELVVIDGDPIANHAEIRNVTLVFKDGLGFDSAKLIESVQGLVGIR